MTLHLNGRNNSEPDFQDILDRLLKNEKVSLVDLERFKNTHFFDVMRTAAERLRVPYDYMISYPQIIAAIDERAPNFFRQVAPGSQIFRYRHPKSSPDIYDITPSEMTKQINLIRDSVFHQASEIENTVYYDQIAKDNDVTGPAKTLEPISPELRRTYNSMGDRLIDAFGKAVQNGSDASMLLRVIEGEGTPYAIHSARRLAQAGVKVYNYEKGEKLGSYRKAYLRQKPKVSEILTEEFKTTNLNELSDETRIDKGRLKRFADGMTAPNYYEAKAVETYYARDRGTPPRLVDEVDVMLAIYRRFPKNLPSIYIQPGEPQPKAEFFVAFLPWPEGAQRVHGYIQRIKNERATEMTLRDLQKYVTIK